jgi:hypothetical protein
MAERVLPPGAVQRTRLENSVLAIVCVCGGVLEAIGPLANPLGVQCSVCGATDADAQRYDGPRPDWTPPKIRGEMYYNPTTKKLEVYE